MEPQDRLQESLEALLSSQPSERWSLPTNQREELEPLLDLADDLALVRNVLPASTFADDLETRLLARAGVQRMETSLRHDDMENAPTLPSIRALESARPDAPRRISVFPSWRVWTALVAAILLMLTVTTFTVAASASPGSALYGVRRWQEDARTNLASSDTERTQMHIQYASNALDALDTAVAQHASTSVYNEALSRFTDEMRQATSALAQVPTGRDHDSISASLDDLRARGRTDLRAALPALAWSQRILTTSALGDLGEAVLTVTKVSGTRSSSQAGRAWTITISGSGFQTGAVLLVRQRPAGHVVSVTSTQMVAQLPAGEDDSLPHDIGVGNPDNTAATTSQVASAHEDDDTPRATGTPGDDHSSGGCSGEQEDHSASCTPTAAPHQ